MLVIVVAALAVYFGLTNNNNSDKAKAPPPVKHPAPGSPTTPATEPATTAGGPGPGRVARKPRNVKLELVPTGQVYVCLVSGSGRRLIPGQIFNTGQSIPTKTADKLLLTLGNNSVKMKVNGAAISVPPSGGSIGYLLVPGAHSPLPPSKQPKCA